MMEGRLPDKVIKSLKWLTTGEWNLYKCSYFFIIQGPFKEIYLQAMEDISLSVLVNSFFFLIMKVIASILENIEIKFQP